MLQVKLLESYSETKKLVHFPPAPDCANAFQVSRWDRSWRCLCEICIRPTQQELRHQLFLRTREVKRCAWERDLEASQEMPKHATALAHSHRLFCCVGLPISSWQIVPLCTHLRDQKLHLGFAEHHLQPEDC